MNILGMRVLAAPHEDPNSERKQLSSGRERNPICMLHGIVPDAFARKARSSSTSLFSA